MTSTANTLTFTLSHELDIGEVSSRGWYGRCSCEDWFLEVHSDLADWDMIKIIRKAFIDHRGDDEPLPVIPSIPDPYTPDRPWVWPGGTGDPAPWQQPIITWCNETITYAPTVTHASGDFADVTTDEAVIDEEAEVTFTDYDFYDTERR